jgi:hypothetical protein
MAYGKHFAGDLKLAPDKFTGRAEFPLDLGRLVDSLLQFCVFTAYRFKLLSLRSSFFREGCRLKRRNFRSRFAS